MCRSVVLFGVSEAYSKSKGGEVWVQCMVFQQWAHESCTPAENSNTFVTIADLTFFFGCNMTILTAFIFVSFHV